MPANSTPAPPIRNLVVFADDWQRHPSSCQHIVSHLMQDMDVTWFNTIGMRRPTCNLTTLSRGVGKVIEWSSRSAAADTGQRASPSPKIISPLMWPSFHSAWSRTLNRRILQSALAKAIQHPEETAILTTIPIVADVIRAFPVQWIYYCVDDFSKWPGLDKATLANMERKLVEGADHIVAAGDNLAGRIRRMGRECSVVTHGVDVAFWRVTKSKPSCMSTLVDDLPRPIALFWGLIDQRLDSEWLISLNNQMEQGSIVLVGPTQEHDTSLDDLQRVHRLGAVSLDELPTAASRADALIMPYVDSPVTRAMQPLKLKEYLATGKPVVARRLPAVEEWADCLDCTQSGDEFASLVIARMESGVPTRHVNQRARLAKHVWSAKAKELRSVLGKQPEYVAATW